MLPFTLSGSFSGFPSEQIDRGHLYQIAKTSLQTLPQRQQETLSTELTELENLLQALLPKSKPHSKSKVA